jgi:Arc/MetJ-type ribon-helix-helix transcriptional regulator
MVTIRLPQDIEAWAREQVASGRADTFDDLVAEALRERQRASLGHKGLVAEAYGQLARGEVFSDAALDAELDRWIAEDSPPRR